MISGYLKYQMAQRERERETDRQTDRQTDIDIERQREIDRQIILFKMVIVLPHVEPRCLQTLPGHFRFYSTP